MNKKKIIIWVSLLFLIIGTLIWFKVNNIPKVLNDNIKEEEKMPKLNIKIGNRIFTATLYDNETTKEFINSLPLTINMRELNGNEKYYYMDNSLKTNPENVKKINKGNLMLYGSNCLVLFYQSFTTSYSYTKLGYLDDVNDLEQVVGKNAITITFEKQK